MSWVSTKSREDHREVRRRTRTISCFTNRKSVNRMLYAVLTYQNRKWDADHQSRQSTHKP
jgi:transposase-like protein